MGKDLIRQTVSLPPDLVDVARDRWEKMGFRSFTDYVETLMRADMAERPVLIRTEEGMVLATKLRQATPAEAESAPAKPVEVKLPQAQAAPVRRAK